MPFAYYQKLTRKQQAIYRRSDAMTQLPVPDGADFAAASLKLREVLEGARPGPVTVARAATALAAQVLDAMDAPPLTVKIGRRRPGDDYSELHGLYEPAEDGAPARITLWMYTARRQQVVKFRTFLRTLAHEICHHLDYELLALDDSFHTAGFFQRESFLYRRMLGEGGNSLTR